MKCFEIGKENREIILFLHGGGLSWWNYREVSRHLSGRFHVVMPILDGHAGSDAPFTTMEENAKRIIAWIDVHFGGSVLLVSQFTLLGDARHGRRPSFSNAERPEKAAPMLDVMADMLRAKGIEVETGRFQTHMEVSLVNDGPVTILLDSRKVF